MKMTNTLTYGIHYRSKNFLSINVNLIKILTAVIYECSTQTRVFVPGKPRGQ